MTHLEVHAHVKIRPGQLEGFKAQAAEIMRITREQDTKTLRYDWFINEDGTDCEVHEAYLDEGGLFEHNQHVMAARAILFRDFVLDHRMTAFGEVSQQFSGPGRKACGRDRGVLVPPGARDGSSRLGSAPAITAWVWVVRVSSLPSSLRTSDCTVMVVRPALTSRVAGRCRR